MVVTGINLRDKFRLAIESVTPGFIDSEIAEFLNQSQISLVNKFLSINLITPLSNLHLESQITFNRNTGSIYSTSNVFSGILPVNFLKIMYCNISLTNGINTINSTCQITDKIFINKLLTTATNNPYIEKPLVMIEDTGLSSNVEIKEATIIIGNDPPFNIVSSINSITAYIGYIKYPNQILIDNNPIELPEYADDIVDYAVKLAIASIYSIKQENNNQQQSQ